MTSQPQSELEIALSSAVAELGDPSTWSTPTGYPSSVVLCSIDAIWSIGIRYDIVRSVVDRYLRHRGLSGLADSSNCTDTPQDFLRWLDGFGSDRVEALATIVNNRNRTSSQSGVLKAQVIIDACELLSSNDIQNPQDLLANIDRIEPRWLDLHGQSSGISWRYLLMLAGADGVKPDRMMHRFLRRHRFPRSLSPEESIHEVVREVKRLFPSLTSEVTLRSVDYQIWSTERAQSSDRANGIEEEVARFAERRDWDRFHTIRNLFLALVGEVGEMAELLQWKSDDEVSDFLATPEGNQQFSDELADIYLYLLRLAQKAGFDLVEVSSAKIILNEVRYPIELSRGNAQRFSDRRRNTSH